MAAAAGGATRGGGVRGAWQPKPRLAANFGPPKRLFAWYEAYWRPVNNGCLVSARHLGARGGRGGRGGRDAARAAGQGSTNPKHGSAGEAGRVAGIPSPSTRWVLRWVVVCLGAWCFRGCTQGLEEEAHTRARGGGGCSCQATRRRQSARAAKLHACCDCGYPNAGAGLPEHALENAGDMRAI